MTSNLPPTSSALAVPSASDDASTPPPLSPLSRAMPFEIVSLIIKESERADLQAWCLVSRGCDRVARPLLWREVTFKDGVSALGTLQSLSSYVRSLLRASRAFVLLTLPF